MQKWVTSCCDNALQCLRKTYTERKYTERKCLTSDCHLSGKLLLFSTVSFWNNSSLTEEEEKLTNQNFEIAA